MNTTVSTPTSPGVWDQVPFWSHVINIILGAVAFPVYVFVVLSTALSKRLHSVSNYLLGNLCTSEMFAAAVNLATSAYALTHPALDNLMYMFTAGKDASDALNTASMVSYCAFCFSSVVILADRYFKVSRPLRYINLATGKTCASVIAVDWTLSLIIGVLMFVLLQTTISAEQLDPGELMKKFQTIWYSFFDVVSLPTVTAIIALIIAIMRILRKHQRKISDFRKLTMHLRKNPRQPVQWQQQQQQDNDNEHSRPDGSGGTNMSVNSNPSRENPRHGARVNNKGQNGQPQHQRVKWGQQQRQQRQQSQHQLEKYEYQDSQGDQQQQQMPQGRHLPGQRQTQNRQEQPEQGSRKALHHRQPAVCERDPEQATHNRLRPHHKKTWYFLVHFFTLLVSWLVQLVISHVVAFSKVTYKSTVYASLYSVLQILIFLQMFLGTMFLVFTEYEHQQMLYKIYKKFCKK